MKKYKVSMYVDMEKTIEAEDEEEAVDMAWGYFGKEWGNFGNCHEMVDEVEE